MTIKSVLVEIVLVETVLVGDPLYTTQYKCSLSKYRGLRGNSYVENADAYVNKHSIVLDEGTLPCITGQRLPHCFESRGENLQTSWRAQLNWDSQQGRNRKTSILVLAFWNFKCKVLKYEWNFRPHATVIWNLVKPLIFMMPWYSSFHANHVQNSI